MAVHVASKLSIGQLRNGLLVIDNWTLLDIWGYATHCTDLRECPNQPLLNQIFNNY